MALAVWELVLLPVVAVASEPVALSVDVATAWEGEEVDDGVSAGVLDEKLPPCCRGSAAWRCFTWSFSSSSSSSSSIKICSKPLVDKAETPPMC